MKPHQFAFKNLYRKKGKTILLWIVLILVNSMILVTNMILRTTNESLQTMQEKTNSKIVAEITSKDKKITDSQVHTIETLEDVSAINRIGRQEAFPANFVPVTSSTSAGEDNLKIALLSYDDLEQDSPFSEMQYRLSSGNYIRQGEKGAVIHTSLADQNGLKIGNSIELSTKDETMVSVEITGIFKSAGNAEKEQPAETTAVNRIENQIFIDNDTYKELLKGTGFDKLSIYSKRPESLDVLETSLQKIFGDDIALSTSDTLYQQSCISCADTYFNSRHGCCFFIIVYVDGDKTKRDGSLYEPRKEKNRDFYAVLVRSRQRICVFCFRNSSNWKAVFWYFAKQY